MFGSDSKMDKITLVFLRHDMKITFKDVKLHIKLIWSNQKCILE